MDSGTRICKICGKEYPYCKTRRNTFRWQDVACCPEHGVQYFDAVEAARNPKSVATVDVEVVEAVEPVEFEAEPVESKPHTSRKKAKNELHLD